MTDAERIDKIKSMVTKWALDDGAGSGDAVNVLGEIMNLLEFDPWEEAATTTSTSGG